MNTLDELGYDVADAEATGKDDPKIVDGKHFLPQHRERIVLVGFRRDLQLKQDFTLRHIDRYYPRSRPTFGELLEPTVDAKYVLSLKLWDYLFHYAKKHAAKGNGFGFGLVDPTHAGSVARTLSARYHKDGSEILVDRGWDKALGESNFSDAANQQRRPRRLTPRECARLMGLKNQAKSHFVFRYRTLRRIASLVTPWWCPSLLLSPGCWSLISCGPLPQEGSTHALIFSSK
jgi:DNA (cytosine-5)-methyltransferase 1